MNNYCNSYLYYIWFLDKLILINKIMNQEDPDYIIKLVLLGDSYVGKNNIVSRYFKDIFTFESKSTVGVEFFEKFLEYKNKKIKAQIWDTGG